MVSVNVEDNRCVRVELKKCVYEFACLAHEDITAAGLSAAAYARKLAADKCRDVDTLSVEYLCYH